MKQKPDASTRPLVGYSLGTGSVEPESLEGATAALAEPATEQQQSADLAISAAVSPELPRAGRESATRALA